MPSVADIGLMGTLGCLLASLQGRDRQAHTQQSGGCCPSPRTAMRHGLSSQQRLTVLCFTGWSPPDVTGAAGPHVCRHQAGTQPHARLSPVTRGRSRARSPQQLSQRPQALYQKPELGQAACRFCTPALLPRVARSCGQQEGSQWASGCTPTSPAPVSIELFINILTASVQRTWATPGERDAQATFLGKTGLQALQRKTSSALQHARAR